MYVRLSEADRVVMTQWATDEYAEKERQTELSIVALSDGDGETYALVVRNKEEAEDYQLMWRGSFDSCLKELRDFGGDLEIETVAYFNKKALAQAS